MLLTTGLFAAYLTYTPDRVTCLLLSLATIVLRLRAVDDGCGTRQSAVRSRHGFRPSDDARSLGVNGGRLTARGTAGGSPLELRLHAAGVRNSKGPLSVTAWRRY